LLAELQSYVVVLGVENDCVLVKFKEIILISSLFNLMNKKKILSTDI